LIAAEVGMHLIIDGYGVDPEKANDLNFIFDVLDRTPDEIGMTKIMPPYVFRYCGVQEQDMGISGIVLIAESHISIHTFPVHGHINIDIFSCKEFDAEAMIDAMRRNFNATHVETHVLKRGLEYLPGREEKTCALASSRGTVVTV
jgi:S-adenosylmethionine decarboxylase